MISKKKMYSSIAYPIFLSYVHRRRQCSVPELDHIHIREIRIQSPSNTLLNPDPDIFGGDQNFTIKRITITSLSYLV